MAPRAKDRMESMGKTHAGAWEYGPAAVEL
jgi:hypothetical protein